MLVTTSVGTNPRPKPSSIAMAEAKRFLRKIIVIMRDGRLIHNPLEHLQLLCPFERQLGIDCCGIITHCSRKAEEEN